MYFRLLIPQTTTSARCPNGRYICLHSSSCCNWECYVDLDLHQFPTSRWFFQFYILLCCQFGMLTFWNLSVFSQSRLSFMNLVNCNRAAITNGEHLTFVEYGLKLCFEKVQCGWKWFLMSFYGLFWAVSDIDLFGDSNGNDIRHILVDLVF